jgi:hypothetical protein
MWKLYREKWSLLPLGHDLGDYVLARRIRIGQRRIMGEPQEVSMEATDLYVGGSCCQVESRVLPECCRSDLHIVACPWAMYIVDKLNP